MINFASNLRTPILLTAIFICLGSATLQMIPIIEVLFPKGSNLKADQLIQLKPLVHALTWGISFAHLFLLKKYGSWKNRFLAIYSSIFIASLLFAPVFIFCSIFTSCFLPHSTERKINPEGFFKFNFVQIQWTIIFASILLMALSSSFPKGLSNREALYLLSTASIVVTASVLFCWLLLEILSKLNLYVKSSFVFPVSIYLVGGYFFYFYLFEKTSALNVHTNFTTYNLCIAALSIGIFGLIINFSGGSLHYNPRQLFSRWLEKYFIAKIILFGSLLKGLAVGIRWLGHDLASESIRDYFFVILIFLIISFSAILGTKTAVFLMDKLKNKKILLLLMASFFLIYIPVITGKDKSWVSEIENNRLFSRFLTQKSHSLLSIIGAAPNRISMKYSRILDKLTNASLTDSSFIKSRIHPDQKYALKKKPHVFVFISDATTSMHMGTYGYHRNNTPKFDSFTKNSILFENYYSNSSATHQNIRTIFSGKYAGRIDSYGTKRTTLLCRLLKRGGYKLYLAQKLDQIKTTSKSDSCISNNSLSLSGNKPEDHQRVFDSIKKNIDLPHFTYIHISGAHSPWHMSEGMETYGSGGIDLYDSMIKEADRQFGEFITSLKKQSLYKDSLIIYTSDHGIGLGLHQDLASYSNVFETNLRIPLAIKLPNNRHHKVKDLYSHLDFLPTLAELLALTTEGVEFEGISFAEQILSDNPIFMGKNKCVFAAATYKDAFSMRCLDGKKFIWLRERGVLNYFDLNNDPFEGNEKIDSVNMEEFLEYIKPFQIYLENGKNSYATKDFYSAYTRD